MVLRVKTIWSLRKTNQIPISPSIRLNVSSVLVAFVPVKRLKVPSH